MVTNGFYYDTYPGNLLCRSFPSLMDHELIVINNFMKFEKVALRASYLKIPCFNIYIFKNLENVVCFVCSQMYKYKFL